MAEEASGPSPEVQNVSTNRLTSMTTYDTSIGTVMAAMALFGSPSIVARSFSLPFAMLNRSLAPAPV